MNTLKTEVLKSVKDYAALKKITVQAVYKQIREEKIKSKKIGNFIFVVTEK